MRALIKDAMIKKYEGDIAEANANLQVYLSNPMGIGEHSEIMVEVDKQVEKIANAEGTLDTLNKYFEKNLGT